MNCFLSNVYNFFKSLIDYRLYSVVLEVDKNFLFGFVYSNYHSAEILYIPYNFHKNSDLHYSRN